MDELETRIRDINAHGIAVNPNPPGMSISPLAWGASFYTLVGTVMVTNTFAQNWLSGIGTTALLFFTGLFVIGGLTRDDDWIIQFGVVLVSLFVGYVLVRFGIIFYLSSLDFFGFYIGLIIFSHAIGYLADVIAR